MPVPRGVAGSGYTPRKASSRRHHLGLRQRAEIGRWREGMGLRIECLVNGSGRVLGSGWTGCPLRSWVCPQHHSPHSPWLPACPVNMSTAPISQPGGLWSLPFQKLHLSEDVAGATFMAAGSSTPELFASVIGKKSPSQRCRV